jgi:hypothetical protein
VIAEELLSVAIESTTSGVSWIPGEVKASFKRILESGPLAAGYMSSSRVRWESSIDRSSIMLPARDDESRCEHFFSRAWSHQSSLPLRTDWIFGPLVGFFDRVRTPGLAPPSSQEMEEITVHVAHVLSFLAVLEQQKVCVFVRFSGYFT